MKGRGKEGAIVKGRKGLTSDNQREGACRADGRGRRRRERIQLVVNSSIMWLYVAGDELVHVSPSSSHPILPSSHTL